MPLIFFVDVAVIWAWDLAVLHWALEHDYI